MTASNTTPLATSETKVHRVKPAADLFIINLLLRNEVLVDAFPPSAHVRQAPPTSAVNAYNALSGVLPLHAALRRTPFPNTFTVTSVRSIIQCSTAPRKFALPAAQPAIRVPCRGGLPRGREAWPFVGPVRSTNRRTPCWSGAVADGRVSRRRPDARSGQDRFFRRDHWNE